MGTFRTTCQRVLTGFLRSTRCSSEDWTGSRHRQTAAALSYLERTKMGKTTNLGSYRSPLQPSTVWVLSTHDIYLSSHLLSWTVFGAGGFLVAQFVLIWRPPSHCPPMFTMAFSASYSTKWKQLTFLLVNPWCSMWLWSIYLTKHEGCHNQCNYWLLLIDWLLMWFTDEDAEKVEPATWQNTTCISSTEDVQSCQQLTLESCWCLLRQYWILTLLSTSVSVNAFRIIDRK